MPSNTMHFKVL